MEMSLNACSEDKLLRWISVCVWNLFNAVYIMDHNDVILHESDSKDERFHGKHFLWKEIARSIHLHLVSWQWLAAEFAERGVSLFYLRPKHHCTDHMGEQVERWRINPRRVMACWSDESFLGSLKRIGVMCHRRSVLRRSFQRYALFISMRWHNARHQEGGLV